MGMGFVLAKHVRVKQSVLEDREWSWLPVAPYLEDIPDRNFKLAAAMIMQSEQLDTVATFFA